MKVRVLRVRAREHLEQELCGVEEARIASMVQQVIPHWISDVTERVIVCQHFPDPLDRGLIAIIRDIKKLSITLSRFSVVAAASTGHHRPR